MAHVLLGVSAGVAIYKSADLASKLTQRGDRVRTLMTPNALEFMTPLAFRAVTREDVYTDTFADAPSISVGEMPEGRIEHISLSEWADILLIAPATADLIAKLAAGLGDNVLTATVLAFSKPVLVAPAMNDRMWANPIVQANIERLRELAGYSIIDPASGHLACGSVGPGRLPEPEAIIARLDEVLAGGSGVPPL